MNKIFTLELLQAINDWQCGGSSKKKGEKLKKACLNLPEEYRRCPLVCFRQIALVKGSVWDLLAEYSIQEKISAWTLDSSVAKEFKNGVPPEGSGYQGAIFCITPTPNEIIINLGSIYRDPNFIQAVNLCEASITRFSDGIGRYRNTQVEVVLEIERLTEENVWSLGGHSSSPDVLISKFYKQECGREPSEDERIEFLKGLDLIEHQPGAGWLNPELTKGILEKMKPITSQLKIINSLQKGFQ